MKAKVNEDLCNGCGPCEEVCPEVFKVVENLARVQVDPVPPEVAQSCRQAAENCPTEAITIED
jgi:ferredoxin